MHLALIYLLSCFIVPTLAGVMFIDPSNTIDICDEKDVMLGAVALLLWPIAGMWLICEHAYEDYQEKLKGQAENVLERLRLRSNKELPIDRETIIKCSEDDLKLVMKAYRKQLVSINGANLLTIREELLSRNMERNLLS